MRTAVLVIALVFVFNEWAGLRNPANTASPPAVAMVPAITTSTSTTASAKVDFDSQIKPILQSKCMPCHFSGGQMHERLPFDRPETIRKLGTKLFTRIKDENHRQLIRDFLAQ